jgi:hypothetical protein
VHVGRERGNTYLLWTFYGGRRGNDFQCVLSTLSFSDFFRRVGVDGENGPMIGVGIP